MSAELLRQASAIYADTGLTPDDLLRQRAELLAAAECSEALSDPYQWTVLERHGWDPRSDIAPSEFVGNLRRAAIAEATGDEK